MMRPTYAAEDGRGDPTAGAGRRSADPLAAGDHFQRIRDLAQPFLTTRRNDVHTRIAEALARELLAAEGGDEAVVIPAVILHDVGWKAVPEELQPEAFGPRASRPDLNRLHERVGAKIAGEILAAVSYDDSRIAEIVSIIQGHDSRRDPDSHNARIVGEADKLWRYTREGFEIDLARFGETSEEGLKRLESNLPAWFRTATATKIARRELALRRQEHTPCPAWSENRPVREGPSI